MSDKALSSPDWNICLRHFLKQFVTPQAFQVNYIFRCDYSLMGFGSQ